MLGQTNSSGAKPPCCPPDGSPAPRLAARRPSTRVTSARPCATVTTCSGSSSRRRCRRGCTTRCTRRPWSACAPSSSTSRRWPPGRWDPPPPRTPPAPGPGPPPRLGARAVPPPTPRAPADGLHGAVRARPALRRRAPPPVPHVRRGRGVPAHPRVPGQARRDRHGRDVQGGPAPAPGALPALLPPPDDEGEAPEPAGPAAERRRRRVPGPRRGRGGGGADGAALRVRLARVPDAQLCRDEQAVGAHAAARRPRGPVQAGGRAPGAGGPRGQEPPGACRGRDGGAPVPPRARGCRLRPAPRPASPASRQPPAASRQPPAASPPARPRSPSASSRASRWSCTARPSCRACWSRSWRAGT